MFTVDNSITDLKVKERYIFKIIYSMNSHPVATPEMSVEEARRRGASATGRRH